MAAPVVWPADDSHLDEAAGRPEPHPNIPPLCPDGDRPQEGHGGEFRDGAGVRRAAWRNRLPDYRLRPDTRLLLGLAIEPAAGLVYSQPRNAAQHGGTGANHSLAERRGGFRYYYQVGLGDEDNGTDTEPRGEKRELKEDYEPPHSPFGKIFALISTGAFTYDDVMKRIPWCVVLMMITDVGRLRKKEDKEDSKSNEDLIQNKEEELRFLGLL